METNESAKQEDSPLDRHYSTIGIDDVFLTPPCHPLPRQYFREGCQESFISEEIVGKIKSNPEDFIVREIAPADRIIPMLTTEQTENYMTIADLEESEIKNNERYNTHLTERYFVPNLTREQVLQQLQKLNQDDEKDVAQQEISEDKEIPNTNDPTGNLLGKTKEFIELKHCSDTMQLRDSEKANVVSPPYNFEKLEIILEKATPNHAKDTIDELTLLHKRAVASISDSQLLEATKNERMSIQYVSVPSKADRTVLHECITGLFPFLRSSTESESRVDVKADLRFFDLITYLYAPQEDLVALYQFYKCNEFDERDVNIGRKRSRIHRDVSQRVVLRLLPRLPREERRQIHKIIQSGSSYLLTTDTIQEVPLVFDSSQELQMTTTGIAIAWGSRALKRHRSQSRERSNNSNRLLFVMTKRKKEHLNAMHKLSRAFNCRPAEIGFAGIKDMHAVTYQFCTAPRIAPHVLRNAVEKLRNADISIGRICCVSWSLNVGDLEGNSFDITIRNIRSVQVRGTEAGRATETFVPTDSRLPKRISNVSQGGFINFYGEQRLGIAGSSLEVGVRPFEIGRSILRKDYAKAIDLIMTGRSIIRGDQLESAHIRRCRQTWIESKRDPQVTAKHLPKGDSMLRERLLLKGIKQHGLDDPLSALSHLNRNEVIFWVNAYQSFVWNQMVSERLRLFGCKVVEGDLIRSSSNGTVELMANISSRKDLSFSDVVLPLPGYDIEYPRHIIGDLYRKMLNDDGICFTKATSQGYTAKGSYRHIVCNVKNLSYKIVTTQDGQDLNLKFDLPKGSYATSFLRELMITTIER